MGAREYNHGNRPVYRVLSGGCTVCDAVDCGGVEPLASPTEREPDLDFIMVCRDINGAHLLFRRYGVVSRRVGINYCPVCGANMDELQRNMEAAR